MGSGSGSHGFERFLSGGEPGHGLHVGVADSGDGVAVDVGGEVTDRWPRRSAMRSRGTPAADSRLAEAWRSW